jgi:transcription-repair coupling factor (superfamily II helicase)
MLEEAVSRLKDGDQAREEEIPAEISIPIDASIPDSYISDPTQKLLTYKRLSRITDEDELRDLEDELSDRFGKIPYPLLNLLRVVSLKTLLSHLKIKRLEYSAGQLAVHVTDRTPVDIGKLMRFVKDRDSRTKLMPDGRIIVNTKRKGEELIDFTKNLLMAIVSM